MSILTSDPHLRARPVPRTPSNNLNTPSRGLVPASTTPSTSKYPAKPKKASPEQLRLENYARTLFDELNTLIFGGGLAETELVWNVRLLTTAGRAERKKQGKALKLTIELSTKVVDSEERVRNTLAHEMCHIAVWVLDGSPREDSHGRHFKLWAARITKARPDIIISKMHSYEINYKFRWECLTCGKVFGRHSNSINTEMSVCGVHNCHGRLKPLFERPARRTPKLADGSKLASGSPRDSPRSLERPSKSPAKPKTTGSVCIDLTNEDDLDDLIKGLGSVSINGGK
ncbi:SprT-like family-domain-containing protein [Gautieria morchelliformis]|nr:SprT-like family-domain-containing protein [Gautieria morchelliformis]